MSAEHWGYSEQQENISESSSSSKLENDVNTIKNTMTEPNLEIRKINQVLLKTNAELGSIKEKIPTTNLDLINIVSEVNQKLMDINNEALAIKGKIIEPNQELLNISEKLYEQNRVLSNANINLSTSNNIASDIKQKLFDINNSSSDINEKLENMQGSLVSIKEKLSEANTKNEIQNMIGQLTGINQNLLKNNDADVTGNNHLLEIKEQVASGNNELAEIKEKIDTQRIIREISNTTTNIVASKETMLEKLSAINNDTSNTKQIMQETNQSINALSNEVTQLNMSVKLGNNELLSIKEKLSEETEEISLIVNSKHYKDQNCNNLQAQFTEEFTNVTSVKLKSFTITGTFYNISEALGNNKFGFMATIDHVVYERWDLEIQDGFYDLKTYYEMIISIIAKAVKKPDYRPFKFMVLNHKGIVDIVRQDSSFVLGLYENPLGYRPESPALENTINFKPFEFFVIHCDIIDKNKSLNNLSKSEILCSVPVKKFDFGELLYYEFSGPTSKKCKDKFQEIRLRVTDEYDRPIVLNHDFIYRTYDGSKVITYTTTTGFVQYELVITRKIN